MLGGVTKINALIDKHIRLDNDELKSSILVWMKGTKWHQEWDWESITERTLFSQVHGFDIYWESTAYEVPSRFNVLKLWAKGEEDVLENIRKQLAPLSPVFHW